MPNPETPKISIIISTYNSSKTLELVLKSIDNQNGIDKKNIEILIIDGYSTDNTCNIAIKYSCKIIYNPARDAPTAKFIGLQNAKNRFVVFLDHDEVMSNSHSLENKIKAKNTYTHKTQEHTQTTKTQTI